MPGRPFHLARRFFEVLIARPLDPTEESAVASWIDSGLWDLFASQQVADQRHGFETGRRVLDSGITDPDMVTAGALHDVGKRHSRLGAVGRTVATVLMATRIPLPRRMAAYRDHGTLGADDLEKAGAPTIAVLFARHHQGKRPASIPEATWEILHAADLARKPRRKGPGGITSRSG